jgi:hypothetical protein
MYRVCTDTVFALYRHCARTAPVLYRYCTRTVSVLYPYCIGTVPVETGRAPSLHRTRAIFVVNVHLSSPAYVGARHALPLQKFAALYLKIEKK